MTATQNIAGLIPTTQAMALLSHNLPRKGKKKRSMTKLAVQNIVGLSLLKETASIAGSI